MFTSCGYAFAALELRGNFWTLCKKCTDRWLDAADGWPTYEPDGLHFLRPDWVTFVRQPHDVQDRRVTV
ncbi:hypothetical protein [Streptomyces solincola]|nr:hypothetical protein [Streptomyces solincola]